MANAVTSIAAPSPRGEPPRNHALWAGPRAAASPLSSRSLSLQFLDGMLSLPGSAEKVIF